MLFGLYPASASASSPAGMEEDFYTNLDVYLQKCVKNAHIPAMSVSIVNPDDVLFSENYGQCESSDTPFLLGSVSKAFTAVGIMQLVEQQKIDLNATLSTYLPHATDGEQITVSQLLKHTSGLGEHQTLENYRIVNPQGVHHYANVNYTLLGKIIETVSGKPYHAYITESLFAPLGLSHTAATYEESRANGLIGGYTSYWGVPVKRAHQYPSSENAWITVPAGYLSASANDLGKYLQMYLRGGSGILSQESIHTMLSGDTVYVEGDIPFWYGYGWATVKEPFDEPVLRHSGLIETGTTCVFILPARNIAIAIATNVNDHFVTNAMMDSLGWGVVQMLLGETPNEIPAGAYVTNHLWIDLIMLLVLLIAILPWCFLPRYARRIRKVCMTEAKPPMHTCRPQGATLRKVLFLIFRKYRKSDISYIIKQSRTITVIPQLVLLHLLLPVFLLLLVPVFFATPLWVAKAFVPDVFITVMLSSTLLLLCGLAKGAIAWNTRHYAKKEASS